MPGRSQRQHTFQQAICLDIYNGHDEDLTIANRDIEAGEELTCDYALFDLDLVEGKYNI